MAGATISPAVVVTVQDALGNTVTSSTASITVAIGTNPGSGTLSGTRIVSAVGGTADFNSLSIDRARPGYALMASATGLASATSAAFGITPGAISAARSLVTVSRAAIASGDTATLFLCARDALGNDLTSGGATVAFAASGGSSTGQIGATTDSGNGTYTATITGIVAGTATSIGASINGSAVTGTLTTITVGPGSATQLAVTAQPAGGTAGASFGLGVTARDAHGNAATGFTGTVTVAIAAGTGRAGAHLLGSTSVAAVASVATFAGLSIDSAASGYTLTASASGLASATSATFGVTAGAASPGTSVVAAARSQVASGDTVTVTLQARDALGNALTSGGLAVAFGAGGGTSTGSFAPMTDRGDGTYSAVFTASVAGTATTISATIGGVAVTGTLPTLTVVAGAASQLQFSASPPASTTAGVAFGATVTARDAVGNVASGFIGTVAIALTAGTGKSGAHLLGTTTVAAVAGVATFTGLSIDSAGTGYTLTASTTGATSAVSSAVGITVGAASAAQSLVSVSRASLISGDTALVTLRAFDAMGNALPSGGLAVAFSVGGGTSTGTFAATTDRGDGSYAAVFTGVTAGTASPIGATIGGVAVTSALPGITVTAAGVSASQTSVVAAPSSLTAGPGPPATVTVTAHDAAGNPVAGVTVTLAATGSGNTLVQPTAPTDASGRTSGTFVSTSATTHTITATVGGVVATEQPVVTVYPRTAARLGFVTQPSNVTAGAVIAPAVQVEMRDGYGNRTSRGPNPGGFDSVVVSINFIPGATLRGTLKQGFVSGVATFPDLTINQFGGYTLTAFHPLLVGATSSAFTVSGGPAAALRFLGSAPPRSTTAGASFGISVSALDSLGNPASTFSGQDVTLAITPGTGTPGAHLLGMTTVAAAGYEATFSGLSIDSVGTGYTLTASASGTTPATTPTAASVTVSPGTISPAGSTLATTSPTVVSGSQVTLVLRARDAFGNLLTTGGATVAFLASGGTSTGTFGTTADSGDGAYAATFTGVLAGSATTITATIGGVPVTQMVAVTVTTGAVSAAQSTVAVAPGSIAADGSTSTITVTAKDSQGNPISGASVVLAATGSGNSLTQPVNTANASGVATGSVSSTVAEAKTVSATIDGVAITQTAAVTVTTGAISLAHSTVAVSSGTVASGSAVTLSLQAKDANGNNLTSGSANVVFTASGGTSMGAIGGTTDHRDGTYTALFTGVVSGTPTTIGATIGGSALTWTPLPTVTVTAVGG